jgi:hypothetical protein
LDPKGGQGCTALAKHGQIFFWVSIQNLLDGRLNQNDTDLLSFSILLQGNPRPVAVLGTRMKM